MSSRSIPDATRSTCLVLISYFSITLRLSFITSQAPKTEKRRNSFQSFQLANPRKPPALAWSGRMFCRRRKLKNFPDPKPAGGCGVVRFWSAKGFFGHAVTRQRPGVHMICFKGGSECLKRLNAAERRWQRVAIAACEVRKEISPLGDEGHKKTRFRGLCSGQVYLPITGEYLPFSVSAFVPVFRMAPALVGAPVLLCVWLAICSASSFTTSSVSSISCATLIVPELIYPTGAIICCCTAATLLACH